MDSEKVSQWYNENVDSEDQRLCLGRLEYEVTLHYIRDIIASIQRSAGSEAGLRIADVGCGTGVYAIPLALEGNDLTICDISSGEVDLANRKAKDVGVRFSTSLALDARKLRSHPELYKPRFYDIVLLPGPLYHILDDAERADVLLAALEMVKSGGFVLAAFVSRNAHLRDVASRDPDRLAKEWEFYEQYLKDGGKYTRGSKAPMIHSTIDEIREVIEITKRLAREENVEVELTKLISCEGFLGFRHAENLASIDNDGFARWLDVVLRTAEDETNLGAADHILAILKRYT